MKIIKHLKGLLYGIAYGLAARGIFELEDNKVFGTDGSMTLSFLFLVPLVIGLITAYYHDTIMRAARILVITMPLFAGLGVVIGSVALGAEGVICAFMAIPIFVLMSFIGSFIGVKIFRRNRNRMMVSVILLLPFFVAPIENYFGLHSRIFTEQTSITINASSAVVWKNIIRVKEISEEENQVSLFQFMGFPRPIKAELDTIAVGGIRMAIFDRGLFFTETVTEVIPEKNLTFSIKADPNSIPPTALDEHVTVGGKFFDVMEGKYEIEKLPSGKIQLHLTSKFRLSTHFNFYSGLWSKLIMRDIQKNILGIVKQRSEKIR